MVIMVAMDLRAFLDSEKIPPSAFAPRVGVTVQALYRYMAKDRLPRREIMAKIASETRGAVTANDFFHREMASSDAAA